jgi:protein-S-isoprenylcysteine O-methyltransferase Ste14
MTLALTIAAIFNFLIFSVAGLALFRQTSRSFLLLAIFIGVPAFSLLDIGCLAVGKGETFSEAISLTLFAGSILLFGWSATTIRGYGFSASFTRHASRDLVDFGPFKYVRHPFYTSYLLYWLAFTLTPGGPIPLAIFAAMFLLYDKAAREEEKYLKQTHPTYLDYCRFRKRFVPFIY